MLGYHYSVLCLVQAELRISVLPTHLNYDAFWPVRKVPLRCTVHFVTYHIESKTYCIVTSVAEPTREYYKFNGEDKVCIYLYNCKILKLKLFCLVY